MVITRSKLSYWLKGLVIVDMIGLIIAAVWFVHIQQFLVTSVRTMGHISNIVTETDADGHLTYTPEVEFQDQHGKTYRLRTIVSGNEHDRLVGEQVPVVYDPANASNASVNTFVELYVGVFILSFVSLVLLFAGLIAGWLLNKEEKRKLDLVSSGQRITANIVDILHLTSINRRGQSPWMVIATWTNPLDSKKYDFSSESVWFDPKQYLGAGRVDVYIEPSNPDQYFMEIPQPFDGEGN